MSEDHKADKSLYTSDAPIVLMSSINTSISNINTKIDKIDEDTKEVKREIETTAKEILETKREVSGAVFRSVSISVGIITAIGAIGAILGFGSVSDLRETVDAQVNQIEGNLVSLTSTIDSFSGQLEQRNSELESKLGTLGTDIAKIEDSGESVQNSVDQLQGRLESVSEVIGQTVLGFQTSVGDLKREISALQAAVSRIPATNSPGGGRVGAPSGGDTDDLINALRLALTTNDIAAINSLVISLSVLQKNLSPFELAVLSTAARRVREYQLAISAAREGLRRLESEGSRGSNSKELKSVFYTLQGDAFQDSNNHANAVSSYEKCLEIDPNSKTCLNNLSSTYFGIGEFEKACTLLETALEVSRESAIANNLSICYVGAMFKETDLDRIEFLKEKALDAASENQKIIEEEGGNAEDKGAALLAKAVALGLAGDLTSSQEILNEAYRLNPSLRLIAPSGEISEMIEAFESVTEALGDRRT